MTNQETANSIRAWVIRRRAGEVDRFSWPTDMAGQAQHARFVAHRNATWEGGTDEEFDQFCLAYAEALTTEKEQDHVKD